MEICDAFCCHEIDPPIQIRLCMLDDAAFNDLPGIDGLPVAPIILDEIEEVVITGLLGASMPHEQDSLDGMNDLLGSTHLISLACSVSVGEILVVELRSFAKSTKCRAH